MHHVCAGKGVCHLDASSMQPFCTQCQRKCIVINVEQYYLGIKAFGIHLYAHLFALTYSIKWIWLWLMNHHATTDRQYFPFFCRRFDTNNWFTSGCASYENKKYVHTEKKFVKPTNSRWQFYSANTGTTRILWNLLYSGYSSGVSFKYSHVLWD